MNDTDVIAQDTVVSVALTFTTFYDVGVLVFNAADLAPYLSIVDLNAPSVQLISTNIGPTISLSNSIEEINISGSAGRDISVGNLKAEILQAVVNYNQDHTFTLKTPAVTVGLGKASPLPDAGNPVADLSNLLGKATGLGIVVLIGVVAYIVLKVVP